MTRPLGLRRSDRAVVGLWFVLAAILVWGGLSALRAWSSVNSAVIVFFLLAAFCAFTAISIAKSKASARWFGGIGGALLIFYAIAVVTIGGEDVGGAKMAIPTAVATAGLGIWTILAIATQNEGAV